MKILRGDRNQCQGCKEYFNSTGAFDKHRTGKHVIDRRCMTKDEMLAKGMVLRDDGFWRGSEMPQITRSHDATSDLNEVGNTQVA
jgi:hypothetical protein